MPIRGTIADVKMVKVTMEVVTRSTQQLNDYGSGHIEWYHDLILVINVHNSSPLDVNVRKSVLTMNGRKRLTTKLCQKLRHHLIGQDVVLVECGSGYRLKKESILRVA